MLLQQYEEPRNAAKLPNSGDLAIYEQPAGEHDPQGTAEVLNKRVVGSSARLVPQKTD
jgi:hypothetical protein